MTADRFRPDRGLTLRIAETWILLLVITAGYGALIGLALQWFIGLPWWICLVVPVIAWAAMYARKEVGVLPRGLRIVAADPERERRLQTSLTRLCALADIPVPRVKIIEVDWVNALALQLPGRRPTIAVTRGLLDTADESRLESVLAHELAHVIHHDATVMTFATNISTAVLTLPGNLVDVIYAADRSLCWVARQCGFAWRSLDHSKNDAPRPARDVGSALRVTLACTAVLVVGLLRVALVLFIFAFGLVVLPAVLLLSIPAVLVLTRLSRYREFAADRTATMLTGRPMALAATLTSLDEDAPKIPKKDLRELRSVSSMAIVPLPTTQGSQQGRPKVDFVERILGSHPPIQKRVERIAEITRDLSG